MKIAVECKSPLLQKALEIFLSPYLTSINLCEIVIKDEKCLNNKKCFYISQDSDADLIKPFSKEQLVEALNNRYKSLEYIEDIDEEVLDFGILERRIEYLTKEYQQNILKAVKAFYEK